MSTEPFPQTHWGRDELSPLFKPVMKFASTAAGSRFIMALVPLDRRVMAATNGKYTLFGPTALPAMLLTTMGRKSGQPRSSALSFLRDGDRLLVLGSNFGGQSHPSWSSNLLTTPDAVAAIGGEAVPVTGTLLTGDERERCLQRFYAYPMYRAYRTRTDRELRLFALTRR
ncbi:MAG: nitroreductase family deazaflavin-dependent oxidoreductase [Mycobacterium sp.]